MMRCWQVVFSFLALLSLTKAAERCGDRPGYTVVNRFKEQEWLGNVPLKAGETYRSCRKLCKLEFPQFEYYQVHNKVNECECLKLKGPIVPGRYVEMRPYEKMSIGYAQSCDCGNHRGYEAESSSSKLLGTVNLASGETYKSCRKRCIASYPNTKYYQQSVTERKKCQCFTDNEVYTKTKKSSDTNFGYADSCGVEKTTTEIQKVFNHFYEKKVSPTSFVFTRKLYTSPSTMMCDEYGKEFCMYENIRSLLQSFLKDLPRTSSMWNSKEGQYRRLGMLMWLVMHNADLTRDQFKSLSGEILDLVYSLIERNDVAEIKQLLDRVPSIAYVNFWIRESKDNQFCDGRDIFSYRCFFSDIFSSISKYDKFVSQNPQTKFIQTDFDYQKGLLLIKLNSIKDESTKNTLEIKKRLSEFSANLKNFIGDQLQSRFSALGKHIQTMADYDRRKGKADIDYIEGRLESFKNDVGKHTNTVTPKMQAILGAALAVSLTNLYNAIGKLVMAIAKNANPLKHIFGGTDPNELMDAIDNVAAAGVKVARAAKVLSLLNEVMQLSKLIQKKLEKNTDFQKNVAKLVATFNSKFKGKKVTVNENELSTYMNKFLADYAAYDPALKLADIVKLGALLNSMVEEGCELTFGDVTVHSAIPAGIISGMGQCVTTKADIEALITTYTQMYDYQFQLMDALAAVVRGQVAYVSAEELNTKFKKRKIEFADHEQAQLDMIAVQLLVVTRIHKLQMVEQFCNHEEYVRGGKAPIQCAAARATLTDRSIDDLINLNKFKCPNERSLYVRIPTKPQNDEDNAYIDLNAIYAGKETIFQIPDSAWLAKHEWINQYDTSNHVYYLKDMKIYLPDIPKTPGRTVRTKVLPGTSMKLLPKKNAKQYHLAGSGVTQIIFEYKDSQSPCNNKKMNPYDNCVNTATDLCIFQETQENSVSPSVFSKWVIKPQISYKEDKKVNDIIKFATDVDVIAEIKLCIVPTFNKRKSPLSLRASNGEMINNLRTNKKCCLTGGQNRYWNPNKMSCESCPDNSESSATGAYCSKMCWKPCKAASQSSITGDFCYDKCWQPCVADSAKKVKKSGTFCRVE